MTNINDPWRNDEVTSALNELPPVDPPSTLVNDVMSTIASRSAACATHPSVVPGKKGTVMAKKVLWIVAATAALALITMRLVGYPPVEKGTEATIGAAQRYQAPQVSSADVKTQDAELQAFLQSDLFRQLTTDKVARQALKNKDFQRALQESTVRAALASPDVRSAIGSAKASDAALATSDALKAALDANAAFKAAFESSAALRAALASPEVIAAMNSAALASALAQPDAMRALSSNAAIAAVLSAPDVAVDAAAAAGSAAGGAARDAVGAAR
jgi:hypothetical protein